jgi:hypothetical protein
MQATISEVIVEKISVTEDEPKVAPKVNPYVITTTQKQEEKEEKFAFDYSKILAVGAKVNHAKFGDGTIINIDKAKKYVKVAFWVGEKTFVISAFETGTLKLR